MHVLQKLSLGVSHVFRAEIPNEILKIKSLDVRVRQSFLLQPRPTKN